MKTASPLRYPGGKASMSGLLTSIRRLNGLGDRRLAEPFAGGAGAALSLLFLEETHEICINDSDPAIFDFWWSLVNRGQPFLSKLNRTRVSMAEWRRQREIYRGKERVSRLKRGFAAYYLNRCNRSGIIVNGGPIGGSAQSGTWKINARFNKPDLHSRCEKIIEYRDRISVSCEDGIDFIKKLDPKSTMFFIDPPYFEKGPLLYLNGLNQDYHSRLAEQMKSLSDHAWVLTYDDCPEIREMYQGWATVRPFGLSYAAAKRRKGREVMVVPSWMELPEEQSSNAVKW